MSIPRYCYVIYTLDNKNLNLKLKKKKSISISVRLSNIAVSLWCMFQPQEYFWIFLFPAFESTHQQSQFFSDTWTMWVSVNTTFLTLITIRIIRVLSAFAVDFPLYCPFLESQGSSFFNYFKKLKFPTFLYIWGFLDFLVYFFI